MSKHVKPCPFCGEYLIEKTEEIGVGYKPIKIYEHPVNKCILALNTDEFPYIVTEGLIDEWNCRVQVGPASFTPSHTDKKAGKGSVNK